MIKELETLLDVSEQLRVHLEEETLFKTDRDQFIETVQDLLKGRQTAIDEFHWAKINRESEPNGLTDQEKEIAQAVVSTDLEITRLLKRRMIEHQTEWHLITKKGKSVSKYTKPYQFPTSNGAFYDKRK